MKFNKEIIEVIILFIILIGVAYVAFSGLFGSEINEFQAMALVTEHIKKDYNLSNSEIGISSVSSFTLNGQDGYEIGVFFPSENGTANMFYHVNSKNGTLTFIEINQSQAIKLVTKLIEGQYNVNESAIALSKVSLFTFEGHKGYKIIESFKSGNKTYSLTYHVDVKNGIVRPMNVTNT